MTLMKNEVMVCYRDQCVPFSELVYTPQMIISSNTDKRLLSVLHSFVTNEMFLELLAKFRSEEGIPPNGFSSHEEYLAKFSINATTLTTRLFSKLVKFVHQIRSIFKLPTGITNADLNLIIKYNRFYLPLASVEVSNTISRSPQEIEIIIKQPVNKNQLIEWIKNNWESIHNEMNKIEIDSTEYISERDFLIVKCRDEDNLPYKKIIEILESKLEIYGLSEENLRVSYKNAKTSLENMVRVSA